MQTDEDVGKVAAAVPVIICILEQEHLMRLKSAHSRLTSNTRRKLNLRAKIHLSIN